MKFVSFILLVLLVSSLGALLYSQNQLIEQRNGHNNEILILQNKIAQQKKDKDTIRDLWEKQASSNDKLITSQASTTKKVNDYVTLVGESIRFVGGEAQVYPNVVEKKFLDTKNSLELEQQNLEFLIQQSIKEKQDSTTAINALYLNAGEDQSNRANPRDGVR